MDYITTSKSEFSQFSAFWMSSVQLIKTGKVQIQFGHFKYAHSKVTDLLSVLFTFYVYGVVICPIIKKGRITERQIRSSFICR